MSIGFCYSVYVPHGFTPRAWASAFELLAGGAREARRSPGGLLSTASMDAGATTERGLGAAAAASSMPEESLDERRSVSGYHRPL